MLDIISRWLAAAAIAIAAAFIIGASALPATAQTAGFDDVPRDAYYATPVADLHGQWVFNGTLCAEGFCPRDAIDRKTMAVWIVRVLDGQDPPSITQSRFNDVDPNSFHAGFIERLAELGVTSGCGVSEFCPDRTVTRAQMAVLLSRAYNLPAGPDPDFDDVPDNAWYASDVARLAASGITAGCATTQFCPNRETTRGQMATFLWRADPPIPLHIVLDAEYEELPEIAAEYRLGRPIEVTVHYCGPGTPSISALVNELNSTVKPFFENQSRVAASSEIQQTITFIAGGIENPDGLALSDEFDYYIDTCLDDAATEQALVLLNSRFPGWNGIARLGGPAISKAQNILGDGYEGVVAHEVAHAFYHLSHPWVDYKQLCHVIADIEQLRWLQYDERKACMKYIENASERLPEAQATEMLRSLVSYRFNHPIYSAIRDLSGGAYLACYQRESKLEWLPKGTCDDPPSTPSTPLPPRLEFTNEILHVSWGSSTAHTLAPVTDYNVQYRVAERDEQWTDVQHDGDALFTRISGLIDGLLYEVRVQAVNRIGSSRWSAPERLTKPGDDGPGSDQRVVLTVGPSAQGERTNAGPCGAQCRWLHVELQNFPPGPHTLVCAHNGISQNGSRRGAWRDATVSVWPNDNTCFFGFPGNEVFVLVNPTRQDGAWYNGIRSNTVVWPDCVAEPAMCRGGTDDLEVRISWGTDASGRSGCVPGQACLNLSYQYIGDWPPPPYSTECWSGGERIFGPFTWSGRPHTGCYYNYRASTAQVVINGVRSNVLAWVDSGDDPPADPTLDVRRGSVMVDNDSCPASAACRWVIGSGSGWPAGEQFWIRCGNFVDTSRNIPVTYRDRFVDSQGNLTGWGEQICYSSGRHTVEVWTQSGVRKTVTIPAT